MMGNRSPHVGPVLGHLVERVVERLGHRLQGQQAPDGDRTLGPGCGGHAVHGAGAGTAAGRRRRRLGGAATGAGGAAPPRIADGGGAGGRRWRRDHGRACGRQWPEPGGRRVRRAPPARPGRGGQHVGWRPRPPATRRRAGPARGPSPGRARAAATGAARRAGARPPRPRPAATPAGPGPRRGVPERVATDGGGVGAVAGPGRRDGTSVVGSGLGLGGARRLRLWCLVVACAAGGPGRGARRPVPPQAARRRVARSAPTAAPSTHSAVSARWAWASAERSGRSTATAAWSQRRRACRRRSWSGCRRPTCTNIRTPASW